MGKRPGKCLDSIWGKRAPFPPHLFWSGFPDGFAGQGPGDEGWAPRRHGGYTLQLTAGSLLWEGGVRPGGAGWGRRGFLLCFQGALSSRPPQLNGLSCRRHLPVWALPAGLGRLRALGARKGGALSLWPSEQGTDRSVCSIQASLLNPVPRTCPLFSSRRRSLACWGRHYMGQPLGGPKTPETGRQLGPILSLPGLLRTRWQRTEVGRISPAVPCLWPMSPDKASSMWPVSIIHWILGGGPQKPPSPDGVSA